MKRGKGDGSWNWRKEKRVGEEKKGKRNGTAK